jgi:hypothetical protein
MSSHKTKDIFELRIFFSENPLASWDSARRAVEVVLREAGDLAPTVFSLKLISSNANLPTFLF